MENLFARKLLACAAIAAWGAASLSGVEIVPDARKIEPLARDAGEPGVDAVQERVLGAPLRYAASFPVFIHLSGADPDIPRKLRDLGGRASQVHPRLYAGAIPRDAARYLSIWPSVAYVEAGKRARTLLDASRPAVQADIVQSGGAQLPASFSGAGTFVGTVDTGLSRTHPDFFVAGQPTSPRVAQWFPTQAAAGVDSSWHGTHVAGIAAGDGFSSGGLFTGMAPGARLLVAQSTFLTTDIPTEIDAILAAAGAAPVAVNLSLGLATGPHDGTSGFEQAVDARAAGTPGSRRIVTVAAGNERAGREHFQAIIPPFGAVTVPVTVFPAGATVDIWADGGDRYAVTASVPGGTASVGTDQPPNGATHFQVFFSTRATASGSLRIERTRNGGDGKTDAYVESSEALFDQAVSVEAGTITEPANGANVIAAGSFNTKGAGIGDISSFSSLGPSRNGRLKPDVAAPGAVIYSARSLDPFLGSGSQPAIVPGNDNYAIMQGTSMAAPHAAGIAALAWESNPSLTGAQMRARLKRTADLPAGVPSPDTTWGNGKVNALRAVSEAVAAITAPTATTAGTAVALSSEDSSGAFDPATYGYTLSYAWSLPARPTGSGATLASTSPAPSFTPDVPGDYTVSLTVSQSSPRRVSAGSDNAVIHVNTVPVASIAGPASTAAIVPVTFTGSAVDPDVPAFGQSIALRWVLVSRPAGSAAQSSAPYLVAGGDNVTLAPDAAGVYEIGLRADDGLDNSALAVVAFQSGPIPSSGRGSGGGRFGCSVARPGATGAGADVGTVLLLFAAFAGSLSLRRRVRGPVK